MSTDRAGARGSWQGVAQIVAFNRAGFAAAGASVAAALALLASSPSPTVAALAAAYATATVALATTSLLASHWVYDRSPLSRWEWLASCVPGTGERWASIHAGLDESSPALRRLFPWSEQRVIDIHDPREMPSRSIARARRLCPAPPAEHARLDALPAPDGHWDALFLLFAAHEVARRDARERLFAELHRVLRPGGRVVIAEHLRDRWNLLAFGPGALHFLPRSEWLRLAASAGLRILEERRITPLVAVFVLERAR